MKRIATATVVICFIAVLHVMGQTTSTSTSKSTSTSNPATKPTSSSTAKPTSKPVPKPVLYWDGTGRWQRPEGDAHAEKTGAERTDKWPSPTYEQPVSEPSGHALNATRESDATSRGSKNMWRCTGPERRPCTEGEVRELSRRMAERSAEHSALASISTLTLESSAGALSCRQVDGALCTHEQLRSLNEHVAEPLRCAIYEVVLKSNPKNPTSTAQNQTPKTSSAVSTTRDNASPTRNSTFTTPNNASPNQNSTFTTPSSNSPTQHHNSTAQNHASTPASHASGWQHRPPATQNHTSTTGNQNSTPPKQQ